MLVTQPIRPRPIKTRSRAGCKYCRDKRKKCSEERPQCLRCVQAGIVCTYEPIKKRKRRTSARLVDAQDSMASDDSNSPTGNTNCQTSPDTNIVTPPDVFQLGAEETRSPTSAVESSYSASIDSAFAFPEDLDDTGSYDFGYEAPQPYEDGFKLMADLGCQKSADVHLPLSLATVEQSFQQPVEDSFFSASFNISWNEQPWSTASPPLLDLLPPPYHATPDCPEDTGLLDHYSKVMLPTMGFVDGVANPFEQHILSLSHRSSAVRSAIYALASAHREYAGLETTEGSACFHERAVAGLSAIIEDGDGFEEALATIILLIQYDLVLQRSSDKVVYNHLQGARHIIGAMPSPKPASVAFFEQVFRYFDVLNALTNGSSPVFAAPSCRAYSPSSPPSPFVSGVIDPVLGMADDLWPTLYRLAELMAMKRELQAATATGQTSKFAVLRTEYQTAYKAIEGALESWSPTLPPGFSLVNRIVDGPESASEAELANIRWITSTALAYRQSALVFLYSTVSEYPSSHGLVQKHTQAALWHCAASVSHGGSGLSILWPLFFSACHAICSRDRGLVRQAFTAFGSKKGVVDTEKPWAVVMDVWRRLDMRAYGKEQVGSEACPDLWRQVAASMKFGLVFG
ncbi:fungal-specific transcription factor domain-containing protein [Colletotrichum godetiae]|uniref:Fungal-specific transcription factor domain-containing protein n=1 Tax=Colletotrichum godetiae TaxID=1209918 RepID=A0AAJ0AZ44_9PEZI|nr:fungal-specific transcription factor domain-containing protein [Colletotrichum godetiae]KAK1700973.1 fungal-specific transcription factor domain-containing protein [Colletotrichum godetiae]